MKNLLIYFFLLSFLILNSCSDEDAKPKNTKRYGGEVSFSANGFATTFSENSIYVAGGIFSLESLLAEKPKFGISIYEGIAETSYDLVYEATSMGYHMDDKKGSYVYLGDTPGGEIVITEINEENETMSGTFWGALERATGEMMIENGTFTDVPYTVQNEGKGSEQIAKIDGEDFSGTLSSWGSGGFTIGFTYTNNFRMLEFNLPDNVEAGTTYQVADLDEENYEFIRFVDGLYSYKANAGTITITEYTPGVHIKGTFSFEAESYPIAGDVKTFTEGSFEVSFE